MSFSVGKIGRTLVKRTINISKAFSPKKLTANISALSLMVSVGVAVDIIGRGTGKTTIGDQYSIFKNGGAGSVWPMGPHYPGLTYVEHLHSEVFGGVSPEIKGISFLMISGLMFLASNIKHLNPISQLSCLLFSASCLLNGMSKLSSSYGADFFFLPLPSHLYYIFNLPDFMGLLGGGLAALSFAWSFKNAHIGQKPLPPLK